MLEGELFLVLSELLLQISLLDACTRALSGQPTARTRMPTRFEVGANPCVRPQGTH